ncbi:hypothetical protein [Enterobacter intestinihominis]
MFNIGRLRLMFIIDWVFHMVAGGHVGDNKGIVHFAGWVGLGCGATDNYLSMVKVVKID